VATDGNNALYFMVLPLTNTEKRFPVHILPTPSRNVTKLLNDRMNTAIAEGSKPTAVPYIATDGDNGYDQFHIRLFNESYPLFKGADFDPIAMVNSCLKAPFEISDWLHLGKTIRSRILKHLIHIYHGESGIQGSAASIDAVCGLEPVLSDRTPTGKMRDAYVIAPFQIEIILKLFDHFMFGEVIYLLPWTLVFLVLRSLHLLTKTRTYLSEIAIEIFVRFDEELVNPTTDDRRVQIGADDDVVVPMKSISLIGTLNTLRPF
jgi:hypothetical protein